MSNAFKKYVENKSFASVRVGVTDAVCNGELSKKEINQLISELEEAGKLNNAAVERKSSNKWSEEYLELLKNETVGGTFSREYLEYLSEVHDYVEKKKNKKTFRNIIAVIVVIALVIAAVIVVITKIKQSNEQKIVNNESRSGSIVAVAKGGEQVNERKQQ